MGENLDEPGWDYSDPKGIANKFLNSSIWLILTKSKSGTERWVSETNTQDQKME